MIDKSRIKFDMILDRKPHVGNIRIFVGHSPMGSFTHQYEIIACVPDTMIAVTFFRGFGESCPWNDKHGHRGPTREEQEYGESILSDWLKKHDFD